MEILDGFNSPKLACYVCNITALVWIVNSPYDEIDAVLTYACLLYYIYMGVYMYTYLSVCVCACLHLYIYIIYIHICVCVKVNISSEN